MSKAILLAGIPAENPALYHRVRFGVGDPAGWIQFQASDSSRTEFIVRDIEMDRAKKLVRVDKVSCPGDYKPASGLSGDRPTATAQAIAECLKRNAIQVVTTDRTLPYIFAWHIQQAGIALEYDPNLGVLDRRAKDEQEIEYLAQAQKVTEEAILVACQTIARASAAKDGTLLHKNETLTCETIQRIVAEFLLEREYQSPHGMIVASTPHSGDCHEKGTGPLKTGEAVIIDVFPLSSKTRYYGDCTRTVVHGDPSDMVKRMHAAVVAAKKAATEAALAGNTADDVHSATKAEIQAHGFRFSRGEISDEPVLPHGTGHGVGLEVHEPILLDDNGGTLMANEALTIEPGLYSRKYGGVRVEDIVVVSSSGAPRSLNSLPEGLDWR